MSTVNIFERALRKHLRFQAGKGNLTTEQLYQLSIQDLDTLAQEIDKQIGEQPKKSFIPNAKADNKADVELKLKLDILVAVIEYKSQKEARRKANMERNAQLANLKELAADKQNEAFKSQSLDDIMKQIAALEEGEDDD